MVSGFAIVDFRVRFGNVAEYTSAPALLARIFEFCVLCRVAIFSCSAMEGTCPHRRRRFGNVPVFWIRDICEVFGQLSVRACLKNQLYR